MRMAPEDYAALELALMATLKAHALHPFMVASDAHAWQVFHKAWNEQRIDGNALYKKYNDAHIQTALRKIFKR